MSSADLRVLFATTAGPRRGFGHLMRCRALARALGLRPLLALRGGAPVTLRALALGCDVIHRARPGAVARLRPDVLVVDDPVARTAAGWIAAGRRAGALVVSVHDLGIGCLDADIVVDGSVTRTACAARGATLAGPRYAILDPAFAQRRTEGRRGRRVLISLGGGPRAQRAAAIANAILRVDPAARIRISGGFLAGAPPVTGARAAWIPTPQGLGEELCRTDVAVLGGGVSLYEACALGIAAVGVPVVPSQEPTVAAVMAAGAGLGVASCEAPAEAVAAQVSQLLDDPVRRRRLSAAARALVDGRGAARVAAVIHDRARRSVS